MSRKIPIGVSLLNSSMFMLQCQLCGQQWSPHLAPGEVIGHKRKLCPNGCTKKLEGLASRAKSVEVTMTIQDGVIFFEGGYTSSTARFPLDSAGVDSAFTWIEEQYGPYRDSHDESRYEDEDEEE
jgi:hypothetical protein